MKNLEADIGIVEGFKESKAVSVILRVERTNSVWEHGEIVERLANRKLL